MTLLYLQHLACENLLHHLKILTSRPLTQINAWEKTQKPYYWKNPGYNLSFCRRLGGPSLPSTIFAPFNFRSVTVVWLQFLFFFRIFPSQIPQESWWKLPTRTMHSFWSKSPQNYHRFSLVHPPEKKRMVRLNHSCWWLFWRRVDLQQATDNRNRRRPLKHFWRLARHRGFDLHLEDVRLAAKVYHWK